MDPNKVEKQSTVVSGIWFIVLLAAVLAVMAVIIFVPDVLKNIVFIILATVLVIAVIAMLVLLFMGIITIPMYMKKGVVVQTDMSYSLDDVREVDGKMEEDRKE